MLPDRWDAAVLLQEDIAEKIAKAARSIGLPLVDVRACCGLRLQKLFSLPQAPQIDAVLNEVDNVTEWLAGLAKPHMDYMSIPSNIPSLSDLELQKLPDDKATVINTVFHYIHSHRKNSTSYALVNPKDQRIYASVTFSDYANPELDGIMPTELDHKDIKMAARVYAFPFAPQNTISKLLAESTRALHSETGCRVLLSYLNSDLGFTGVTYQSANWQRMESFYRPQWAFYQGSFLTERETRAKFNIADDDPAWMDKLKSAKDLVFCKPQAPLLLYAFCPDTKDRKMLMPKFQTRILPPTLEVDPNADIIAIDSGPYVQDDTCSQEVIAKAIAARDGRRMIDTGNLYRYVGVETRKAGICLEDVYWDINVREKIQNTATAMTERLPYHDLFERDNSDPQSCVREGLDATFVGQALNECNVFSTIFGDIISDVCKRDKVVVTGCTMGRVMRGNSFFLEQSDDWIENLEPDEKILAQRWKMAVLQRPDGAPRPRRNGMTIDVRSLAPNLAAIH